MESSKTDINNKTIQVIRLALEAESDVKLLLRRDEVQEIERIAVRQSILPIVLLGLEKLGCSELLSPDVTHKRDRAIYDYLQRNEAIKQISRVFDDGGIDYIPLKGAVLKDLYPQPWMRTCNDIDVLIRSNDIDRATVLLQENTSFKRVGNGFHDVSFINERVHLELHFSILDDVDKMDEVFALAWNYANHTGLGNRFTFSPEFQLFYITAHACKHFLAVGGIGIRPLVDLWLLKTYTKYDEKKVEELCHAAGILMFYNTCSRLISVWFEDGQHTDLTKDFEELALSGSVFGSDTTKVLIKRRNKKGIKYIMSRLFVKNSRIKGKYPICERYPVLIPFYQMRRWVRLINTDKRKAARQEILFARNIDQKEIDKYDKMLKKLGF